MEDPPFSISLWLRSVGFTTSEKRARESYFRGMSPPSKVEDVLNPPFDSEERKSTVFVATFNLVATIVGGGVLSLPLAFAKCGVVLGTVLMIFAAVITDRSLYLLCLCARQSGVHTYGAVGRVAYGPTMEWGISALLFVFLLFVLVAYMVLVRDIWTPLVGMWIPNIRGDFVLLGAILLMSPFLVQRTLHALRFNCYVGFASVSVLCMALCHRAHQKITSGEPMDILYVTPVLSDALFAFPIMTLSFLSSFNVLEIQSELIHPSKPRVRWVLDGAVLACFTLTYLFGLAGYIYAGPSTEGNILLNLDHTSDTIFLLGRIGCGITILLATAMITLPCRQSILEVIDTLRPGGTFDHNYRGDTETCITEVSKSTQYTEMWSVVEENSCLLPESEEHEPKWDIYTNDWVHYGSTLAIVLTCFVGAVAAPNVAIVWSLCGSSMAFLISFLLPAACYLEIQRRQPNPTGRIWIYFSWFLIAFSIVGAVACSIQTALRILGLGAS